MTDIQQYNKKIVDVAKVRKIVEELDGTMTESLLTLEKSVKEIEIEEKIKEWW